MKMGLVLSTLFLTLVWISPAEATFRCRNKPVYVNRDTMSDVLEKCGEPAFRLQVGSSTQGRTEATTSPSGTITGETEEKALLIEEWTYHCRQRKWTLTFEGGLLKSIKQGSRLEYGEERNRHCGN